MGKTSVLVVGAGAIGCSLADELTRRGAEVTVLDAAEAGSGTSAATFAWANSNDKKPGAYSRLNLLGLQAHQRIGSRGDGRWFHQTGTIQIAQSDEELTALTTKVERLRSTGYAAATLAPGQVLELEPALHSPNLVGGALYADEGWVDVATMCLVLLQRAIQAGAVFRPYRRVQSIADGRVAATGPDGSPEEYSADVVVLAAGNGTRTILAHTGYDFPTVDPEEVRNGHSTETLVGIISTTGPVASSIRHLVRATGIALRPARNGGITFADHPTGGEWQIDDPRVWTVPALLLERARDLYPLLRETVTETVSLGTRVLPTDGLTIADWVNRQGDVYAIATHSGITLAPHLARVVAEEVLGGARDDSIDDFGLSRFQ